MSIFDEFTRKSQDAPVCGWGGMAAGEIVMDEDAVLGPVDPQPGRRWLSVRCVPALYRPGGERRSKR